MVSAGGLVKETCVNMRRIFMTTAMAIALVGGTSSGALAASAGPSCIGLGSSTAPKPGTTPADATSGGGRATIAHFVKDGFAALGFSSPGGAYSFFAKIHATDISGCPFEE
ncbi:MAG: hypothetical protein M3O91_09895 [Chloroflexota bacterium]|nr:hypothetical protein [Chloroflexota bacterium]